MQFSDHALSQRLERAEGVACAQYAEARRGLIPASTAEAIECAGANVVFDGIDSPCTQTFGLGMFEELTATALDQIERFFHDRGAPVNHEVSPFAGTTALELLCERNYRPFELTSILYQPIAPTGDLEFASRHAAQHQGHITVRVTSPDEVPRWNEVSTRGWTHEHPELAGFMSELGAISAARAGTVCFLAEIDGEPGAAGSLCIHKGVALFGGAATLPEMRRRGLQSALLNERMNYARNHGCDLAMMGALPGSNSQRNAERQGFRIAYTRTKWRLGAHR
jgi:GNAT superfamily N-acetyltransferase